MVSSFVGCQILVGLENDRLRTDVNMAGRSVIEASEFSDRRAAFFQDDVTYDR